jgi:hypothetical protein
VETGNLRCVLDWGHQNGMVRPLLPPRQWQRLARRSEDKEHPMSQELHCAIAVVGIDIGKNSFHVVGHDQRGAIVLRAVETTRTGFRYLGC